MTIEQKIEEPTDQFHVGVRVLAVDDDPTCLILLESLLRKCKYHVTTRTHAVAALNLLRENKNQFDLVISDVHMPDMDGFKLLELVGLEMDLPVIMLSANGDPKLVMKGITHGACNYLLKPVRIEELQIIWQHVIRKKKVDPSGSENAQNGRSEPGAGNGYGYGYSDQKSTKKRKDQVGDDDEDHDENGLDSDDPSAQKKPRVVWSIELHRKFVAAVNHLGIDKAVPKRILELMNVEKLTRENVASHLQKYRLYLRRISCVQSQQANMVAAFGNTAPTSYMMSNPLNGMGGFNTLSGSPQFQNATFRSFQPNGMLGRLNSPVSLGIQRLQTPVQANHSQFSGFTGHAADQGVLKGMPISFEFSQLQDNNNRSASHVGEVLPKADDLKVFPYVKTVGNMNSSRLVSPNNTLMFQGHLAHSHSNVGIGNQSLSSPVISSHFSDRARGNGPWPVAVQSSSVHSSSYAPYSVPQLIKPLLDDGTSIDEPPLSVTNYQFNDTQAPVTIGHERKKSWDNASPGNLGHPVTGPYGRVAITNQRRMDAERISDFNSVDQPTYFDTISMQPREADNSKPRHQIEEGKSQVHRFPKNVGSLEDLVSSLMN